MVLLWKKIKESNFLKGKLHSYWSRWGLSTKILLYIVLFCLKKKLWKNALHQWRNPRPSQGSFLWLSDLFASGYIISVFDISVKHKFNTFCYQNFSTLIVKAYFCSSSCLLFFFPQIWKSSSLLYAVKTPYRQT